jgi:hypothetical protein
MRFPAEFGGPISRRRACSIFLGRLGWQGRRPEIGGPLYQEPDVAIAVQAKPPDLYERNADFHQARLLQI